MTSTSFSAERLRERFEGEGDLTVGIEEEVMLLDPESLDLAPVAAEVLERLAGDPALKPELPAAHVEIVTRPHERAGDAVRELAAARRRLVEAASGLALPAAAGAHPFAAEHGDLFPAERYREMQRDYGVIARRQLVCALQIHVAVRGAERALAVYNALRGFLPEIAALAAAAPYHRGEDSGLASVRPTISQLLPRQGVPPAVSSWSALADELAWGAAAGSVPEPRRWWWELRPNFAYGTLEVRVPDAQARVSDVAGVASFVHALVGLLCERFDDRGALAAPATWRIEENRFSACAHGVEGEMADLGTGIRRATRERLGELVGQIEGSAARLGCTGELGQARRLVRENGAMLQRRAGGAVGAREATRWLAENFGDEGKW
ncbi:MAG TPA: YbdK family carboxylate-amine ligase [Thermoleophilaceae bacterium]|nr:YbdK family carboxylate-amine ligase [Thermoleophilaceae bacterium]